jgi:hypothetical protein
MNQNKKRKDFKLKNDGTLDKRYNTSKNSKITNSGMLDGRCKNAQNTKEVSHTKIKITQKGAVDKRSTFVKNNEIILKSNNTIDGRSKAAKSMKYLNK